MTGGQVHKKDFSDRPVCDLCARCYCRSSRCPGRAEQRVEEVGLPVRGSWRRSSQLGRCWPTPAGSPGSWELRWDEEDSDSSTWVTPPPYTCCRLQWWHRVRCLVLVTHGFNTGSRSERVLKTEVNTFSMWWNYSWLIFNFMSKKMAHLSLYICIYTVFLTRFIAFYYPVSFIVFVAIFLS